LLNLVPQLDYQKERRLKTFAVVDDRLVEDSRFLKRAWSTPYFKRKESIVRAEAFGAVLRDPKTGLWRMWYSWDVARDPKIHVVSMDILLCYAESQDGVNWTFPKLGLIEENGSRDNNIVLGHHQRDANGRYLTGYSGAAGFCIIDNEITPHPAARGRFTGFFHASATDTYGGICCAYSDDGLRWTAYPENPVLPGSQDTQNCVLYDPKIGKYVAYQRPTIYCGQEFHANRKLARCESSDLVHWSPSRVVIDTDELDAPAHDVYVEPGMGGWVRGRSKQFQGITPFIYNGCYLAHTWFYDVKKGTFTDEVVRSDDGIRWLREPLREPFIAHGRPEGFKGKLPVPMSSPPVLYKDELYMYISTMEYDHHEIAVHEYDEDRSKVQAMLEDWDLYVLAIKRDRWIGYEACEIDAEFLSTPFEFEGGSPLCVNAKIGEGGFIKVEAEDQWGRPIKDLHLDEIMPVTGPIDEVDIPVLFGPGPKSIWKLPPIGPIRLRMRMKNATLYGWSIGGPAITLPERDKWK
jgi:hypothetical protein